MEKRVIVFELPPLKTREEKRIGMRLVDPAEVPNEKRSKLNRLINQQRKDLGFEAIYPEK
jgi:hypothetical protein